MRVEKGAMYQWRDMMAGGRGAAVLPRGFVRPARRFSLVVDLAAEPLSGKWWRGAATLGLLWLSTVPPTNGIVAHVFGVRYLAMLSGFTFFSHQIGSFLGAWLGGKLYDATGSYDIVWYLSIALGVIAGVINLPIDEGEIRRAPATVAPA